MSPSSATARCARAGSSGTGRRSRAGTRSAGWHASSSPREGERRSSPPRAATSDAVSGEEVAAAAPLGRRGGATTARALRRQHRARSREPRQHPRPGAHRHRGRRGRHGCVAARPVAASRSAARLEGTEHRPEIPILPAALGIAAGAVGAALLRAVRPCAREARHHPPVVRRRSGDPARGRSPGRRRRSRRRVRVRPHVARHTAAAARRPRMLRVARCRRGGDSPRARSARW